MTNDLNPALHQIGWYLASLHLQEAAAEMARALHALLAELPGGTDKFNADDPIHIASHIHTAIRACETVALITDTA